MSSIDSITLTPLDGTIAVPAPDSDGELTLDDDALTVGLPVADRLAESAPPADVVRELSLEVGGAKGSTEPVGEVEAEVGVDVDDVVEGGSRSS